MKSFFFALLLLCCSGLSAQNNPAPIKSEKYAVLKVYVTSPLQLREMAEAEVDFDHIHGDMVSGVEMYLTHSDIIKLDYLGIKYEIVIEDFHKFYEERSIADQANLDNTKSPAANFGYGSVGGFYSFSEIETKLDEMHTLFPNITTAKYSIGTTIEGRSIWALKISDNPDVDEPESVAYYDALHHAREPLSMAVTINYMFWLLENYNVDPAVTYIINNRELYFVPVVNPDGYEYNRQTNPNGGGLWRKNRRGGFGVDLNRNYGYQWGFNNSCASSVTTSSTYRGAAPFSEPESAAVRDFVNEIEPTIAFSTHATAGSFLMPYGYNSSPPDFPTYAEWASDFLSENDYPYGTTSQMLGYTSCGTTRDYLHNEGIYAWTPEIDGSGFWPAQSEIFDLVDENVYPMFYQAWIAGGYADVQSHKIFGDATVGSSVELEVELKNKGAGADASNLVVEIIPNSPLITVDGTRSYGSIAARQTKDNASNKFNIAIDPAFSGGAFELEIRVMQDGTLSKSETVEVSIGTSNVLFGDNAENGLGNWSTAGNGISWGINTDDSYSGNQSFGDSNGSNFTNNTTNALSMQSFVNLANADIPYLEFFAKWSFEPGDNVLLQVATNGGTNWTNLKTYTAAESWTQEKFNLSAYVGSTVRFRFVLVTDGDLNTDGFYFDDFMIVDYQCPTCPACASSISTFPYAESFEGGINSWSQGIGADIPWTANSGGTPSDGTGPNSASNGSTYMYVESSDPNYPTMTALMTSPCFDLTAATQADFSFDYHMYGNQMGSLSVDVSLDDGLTWTNNIWTINGDQGQNWQSATLDLSNYLGEYVKLRFDGTTGTGFRSDIAVDNISLTATQPSCSIGASCDDGDACTTGETYDANCNCIGGSFQDSDNDGVCDANDLCPNFDDNLIGTACDDGDACTTGETYDANCGCSGGTLVDSDNDGVCDTNDLCPNFDDNLIGTACDDGDACTTGETYDNNCGCSGGTFQDSDNDGVCDANDLCPNFDDNLIGTACDDGDACTTGETYDANCGCSGGTFQDSDNDGVCDANDVCPSFDDNLIGTACDDGNACTNNSIYSGCICQGVTNLALSGTASMSSEFNATLIAENLNDDIITNNSNDLAHTSVNLPNEWVEIDLGQLENIETVVVVNRTSCCSERLSNAYLLISDTPFPSNTNLTTALANADYTYQFGDTQGVAQLGIDVATSGQYVRIQKSGNNSNGNSINLKELQIFGLDAGGDADNDGVCDANDLCPNFDDNLIGTACDDGDACTIGETYDANCGCSGGIIQDSDNDGVCDANDLCPNFDDNLIGTACDDGDACTTGETYDNNCGCSGGIIQDSDNDGVCDANDLCPNFDDNLIGTACDDGDACTTGETYDSNCGCSGGIIQDSDNDGVCDANDLCPNFDDNLIGTACDDGDACTTGETYDANCGCSGGIIQDSDNDGVCDANDLCPNDANNLCTTTLACASTATNTSFEFIEAVTIGTLTNTSGSDSGYGDYSSMNVSAQHGETLDLILVPGYTGNAYNEHWGIWVDLDNDGVFDPVTEMLFSGSAVGPTTGVITIPAVAPATYNMRVSMQYNAAPPSCGTFSYGEVEDYKMTILATACVTGNPCDDGDICTANDVYDNNCNCSGTLEDSDSDGICDALDQCPGFDDTIDINGNGIPDGCENCTVGMSCDDGDNCTDNDTIDANCNCAGTYIDSDGDGICDTDDACPNDNSNSCIATPLCASNGANTQYEHIAAITIGTMTNDSGNDLGYGDYTSTFIQSSQGDNLPVTLVPGFSNGSYLEYWNIWADFNKDGELNNAEELLFSGSSQSSINGQVTIPTTIATGDYTMRVSMQYNQSSVSCGTLQYGEVEDYTLTVNNAGSCSLGAPCDDGNNCTVNDMYDTNCDCTGTILDTDGDGVCDAEDTCPNGDDNIDINNNGIGDACEGCPALTLTNAILGYDSSEDFGTAEVLNQGTTAYLTNNAWKAILVNYNITSNTVITFDFRSTVEGEIHELSFDSDLDAVPEHRIVLYGNQGIAGNYPSIPTYTGNGAWESYAIPLGDLFTGTFDYLILTSDDDATGNGNSYFRNIVLFEDVNGNMVCENETNDLCPNLDDNLIGTPCDDGDDCTIGELYDMNCGCSGGIYTDVDGDGFCIAEDTNDSDPCVPDDSNCSTCEDFDFNDFENGYNLWIDGGSDASRASYPTYNSSGLYSVRLRDNSGVGSSIYTDVLNLNSYSSIEVSFSFVPNSMENGEDLLLEVSNDGGDTFTTVESWISGSSMINETRYDVTVTVPENMLSTLTVLRIRCDASSNADRVYVDDILIEACGQSITLQENDESEAISLRTAGAQPKGDLSLFPNPVIDVLYLELNETTDVITGGKILTMDGQLIRNLDQKGQNMRIDISALDAGKTYMLLIEAQNGNRYMERFIKI